MISAPILTKLTLWGSGRFANPDGATPRLRYDEIAQGYKKNQLTSESSLQYETNDTVHQYKWTHLNGGLHKHTTCSVDFWCFTFPSQHSQVRYGGIRQSRRRRVNLPTVLFRPPSGHRPGRRQVCHARILQIGLHTTQSWSVWAPPRHRPAPRISTKKNPMGGILRRKSCHMPIEALLALTNYAGDLSQSSFP